MTPGARVGRGFLGAAVGLALIMPGCGLFHRSRLEDCSRRVQVLQAESTQLRDEAAGLRARNRDLAQRAVDDARRIRGLEETNQNLERSVVAYQEERNEIAAAFDELQRLVRASTLNDFRAEQPRAPTPPSSDGSDRRLAFARAHPSCTYDPSSGHWTIPSGMLFEASGSELSPPGRLFLQALGRVLDEGSSELVPAAIVSRVTTSALQLASLESPPDAPPEIAQARAEKVREELARVMSDPRIRSVEVRGETRDLEPPEDPPSQSVPSDLIVIQFERRSDEPEPPSGDGHES